MSLLYSMSKSHSQGLGGRDAEAVYHGKSQGCPIDETGLMGIAIELSKMPILPGPPMPKIAFSEVRLVSRRWHNYLFNSAHHHAIDHPGSPHCAIVIVALITAIGTGPIASAAGALGGRHSIHLPRDFFRERKRSLPPRSAPRTVAQAPGMCCPLDDGASSPDEIEGVPFTIDRSCGRGIIIGRRRGSPRAIPPAPSRGAAFPETS